MTRKAIHFLDFPTLVMINREVVSLTGEVHEYTEEDEKRLRSLVREIGEASSDERFDEAVIHRHPS